MRAPQTSRWPNVVGRTGLGEFFEPFDAESILVNSGRYR